jgi:hypothetical protein
MSRALVSIAVVRIVLGAGLLGGCDVTGTLGGGGASDHTPSDDDSSSCGGALPPPSCGAGACSCCGSCDVSRELCMTADWSIGFGYGHCYAAPAQGSMTASVRGTTFVAMETAAIANGTYLQVSGRIETPGAPLRQITIQAPAALGTTDCVASPLIAISYAEGEIDIAHNEARLMPRPPCSLTLTAIGELGERIEGSFSVTLLEHAPQDTQGAVEITAGTFSVERVPYP